MIADACISSRLLHGAGAWSQLSKRNWTHAEATYMRPFQIIADHRRQDSQGKWHSFASTCDQTSQPSFAARLVVERARFFGRICRAATPTLRALLATRGAAGWKAAVVSDLQVLRSAMADKLGELPSPSVSTKEWQKVAAEHPTSWASLLKAFKARTVEARGVADRVRAQTQPPGVPGPREGGLPGAQQWICYECGEVCREYQALCLHRRTRHGARRDGHRYVIDGFCPACRGYYHSRLRALEHLERGSSRCRAMLDEGSLPEFDEAALEAADQVDRESRRAARAAGLHEQAGPPALTVRRSSLSE